MSKLLIAVLLLFCTIKAIDFDSGRERVLKWHSDADAKKRHVLQAKTVAPRHVTKTVKFNKQFSSKPQVMVAPTQFDWQANSAQKFEISIHDIKETEFSYTITVNSAAQFYTYYFDWMAVQTNRIKHGFHRQAVEAHRTTDVRVQFEKEFEENDEPVVAVWMVGAYHISGQNVAAGKVTKTSRTGFTYTLGSGTKSNVSVFQFQWIAVPKQAAEVVNFTDIDTINIDGVIGKRASKDARSGSYKITADVQLGGLSGWATAVAANTRLSLSDEAEDGKIRYICHTWANSVLYGCNVSYIFINLKSLSKVCATVYTECQYEGKSAQICNDRANYDLRGQGIDQIKSIKVPEGYTLTLNEDKDLEGKKQQFKRNEVCLEEFDFKLLGLKRNIRRIRKQH